MTKKEKMKGVKISRKDVAYRFYSKMSRKGKRVRVWGSKATAKADALDLRQRGYKVRLIQKGKAVVIIGKTTRGYERTATGKRAIKASSKRRSTIPRRLPKKKPYKPSGFQTFRQPSITLRKYGWGN